MSPENQSARSGSEPPPHEPPDSEPTRPTPPQPPTPPAPPAPAPRRSRRVDATRNRDALLAAAQRLFQERGPQVPLDEVAKAARVGNATLYRHFATRAELIIAVYAEEVAALGDLSERLSHRSDPGDALTEWLRVFVHHVATKRDLALAVPDAPEGQRGALFDGWHAAMHDAAERLLGPARDARAVGPELTATDLLALASGIALTGLPAPRLDTLLNLARDGYRLSGRRAR